MIKQAGSHVFSREASWSATICLSLVALAEVALATQARPLPVPEEQSTAPQLDFRGKGVGTAAYRKSGEHPKAQGAVDYSDSELEFGVAQLLYNDAVGSFRIGALKTEEAERDPGRSSGIFTHRAFVDYQSQKFEVIAGRADNATAHFIDFPTLRDDDLLSFTNAQNPFSTGKVSEEHRYADQANVILNQGFSFFESIHAQHLIDSVGVGQDQGLNSFGASLQHLATTGIEVLDRIPVWGLGVEHLSLTDHAERGLTQCYGGGVINLNQSITDRWSLSLQGILSRGSDLEHFDTLTDSFQADSNSGAVALEFSHDPFGMPGYSVSLTGGYKNYTRVDETRSMVGALTAVKRLGQGFNLVSQYMGTWRDQLLADVASDGMRYEQKFEVGFSMYFDAVFNQHIRPRKSFLNQKFDFVPN